MNNELIITLLLIAVSIWDLVWKGMALYAAARHGQKNWFIPILLLNTVGILPIVYLKFFQPKPAGTPTDTPIV